MTSYITEDDLEQALLKKLKEANGISLEIFADGYVCSQN